MSSPVVAPAMPVIDGHATQDVELKDQAVSAKMLAFTKLIDPFAEGSKFTPINETTATDDGNTAVESVTAAHSAKAIVDEATGGDDKKDGAPAKSIDSEKVCLLSASLHLLITVTATIQSCTLFSTGAGPYKLPLSSSDSLQLCKTCWFPSKVLATALQITALRNLSSFLAMATYDPRTGLEIFDLLSSHLARLRNADTDLH